MLAERARPRAPNSSWPVPSEVPRLLRGDPGRLRQVLVNLVATRSSSPRAGEVVVSVSRETEAITALSSGLSCATRAWASPPPSGRNVPSLHAGRQLDDPSLRWHRPGSGDLQAARDHEWTARSAFKSEPGKGSTFWSTAQFRKTRPRPAPGSPANADGWSNLRVLVVDDNATPADLAPPNLRVETQKGSAAGATRRFACCAPPTAEGHPYDLALLMSGCPRWTALRSPARSGGPRHRQHELIASKNRRRRKCCRRRHRCRSASARPCSGLFDCLRAGDGGVRLVVRASVRPSISGIPHQGGRGRRGGPRRRRRAAREAPRGRRRGAALWSFHAKIWFGARSAGWWRCRDTSTRRFDQPSRSPATGAGRGRVFSNWAVNQNVEPLPGSLFDADLAVIMITSCLEIARPRPVPP